MKITSEGTRGEEPRAPLFSFWNSANIGALPGIHFCLSTTSTSVTSARYPTKASTIITYALSPKSSVYILLHRHGLDGLPASVQFDDDSVHFNGLINRYADGICRRIPIGLSCKNEEEGSRPDVGKRQNMYVSSYQHLTFRRSHISIATQCNQSQLSSKAKSAYLCKKLGPYLMGMRGRRLNIVRSIHRSAASRQRT